MQYRKGFRPRHGRGRTSFTANRIIKPKTNLDINCNVGQGFGANQNPFEEKIIPYVTSINVSCGFHAGDPLTMARIIDIARNYNVSIGALIGYPDLVNNGEREVYYNVDEIRAMVLYQLGALNGLLHSRGLEIRHVRTHGFLYKQLYTDLLIAETVGKAIAEFSSWITLVGLSGHILTSACHNANIKFGQEVQIHKRYRKDGTLLTYNEKIDGKNFLERAIVKVREIIETRKLTCDDNTKIPVNIDTVHIPSNSEEAIELAKTIRSIIREPKPLNLDKYDAYFADAAALRLWNTT